MDVHTKDAVNEQMLRKPWLLQQLAGSITLDLNAHPCDDLAPLRHMMEERKREKLRQHLTQAIVSHSFALVWLIEERQVSCMLRKHTSPFLLMW